MTAPVEAHRLRVDVGAVDAVDAWLHPPAPQPGARSEATAHAGAPRHAVILLPGAAGDPGHAGLVALAEELAAGGHAVLRVTWPHRQRGRGAAPRAEASVEPLARIVAAARALLAARVPELPPTVVLGGRSYGGRVASLLVAREGGAAHGVTALLCVAYPLVPPAQRDGGTAPPRDAHWGAIDVPTCFVVGTRDHFHDAVRFAAACRRLPTAPTVVELTGGDHELRVRAIDAVDGRALDAADGARATAGGVLAWLERLGA